jgi:hypothetical protein
MIEAGQNDPRISKNRTRKTLSDWGSVRKPLLFGFPTPRDLPYAYILGVSLLRAKVEISRVGNNVRQLRRVADECRALPTLRELAALSVRLEAIYEKAMTL